MYKEREISSLVELRKYMEALDEDEGIRAWGDARGFKEGGFIFITRSKGQYCVNICDRVWDDEKKTFMVGGSDVWYYFDDFTHAWKFVKSLVRCPLKAWLY